MWQKGGTYSELTHWDGAIFRSSDDMRTRWANVKHRAYLAQTAIYLGAYRKERNAILSTRHLHSNKDDFEGLLDSCRDSFKRKVFSLWEHYPESGFLPEFLCDFNSSGMQGLREKYLKKVA
jgi:hypothetical protein